MAYSAYECMTLEQMLERVKKYDAGENSCDLIARAWRFAEKAHEGQKRQSGEPYFLHPNYVASILTELMIDPPTIAASLLHDTVEDCENITMDTIRQEFGEEVARLVDGVLAAPECYENESISSGLLEYPQYTRPYEFHGVNVPDVLISGHHENIDKWRHEEALRLTQKNRPDIIEKFGNKI